MGEAERLVLLDVPDREAEARAVAGSAADLAARLGRDDDPHLADAGGGQASRP